MNGFAPVEEGLAILTLGAGADTLPGRPRFDALERRCGSTSAIANRDPRRSIRETYDAFRALIETSRIGFTA